MSLGALFILATGGREVSATVMTVNKHSFLFNQCRELQGKHVIIHLKRGVKR